MDSSSPSSPAPRPVAERSKSSRATRSSLLLHGAAAVAFSKSRKPSAIASKSSPKLHPPVSYRIPAPSPIENIADNEPALILPGLSSSRFDEESGAGLEALRREIAVSTDHESLKKGQDLIADEDSQGKKAGVDDASLKEIEAGAEDHEALKTGKVLAKDESVVITEALVKGDNQNDASLWEDMVAKETTEGHGCSDNNDLAEQEEMKGNVAENLATDRSHKCMGATTQEVGVPFDQVEKEAVILGLETKDTHITGIAQQDPCSPVADMETLFYDEQNPKSRQMDSGLLQQMEKEADKKQSECGQSTFISEQERFLFIKGEPIFKELIQSSEGLPAAECSILKSFREQDVTSLSQPETPVIAASDLKPAHSSTALHAACDGVASIPSLEDKGFIEAAMFALAKDVFASRPAIENVHCMTGRPAFSCPWWLSKRGVVVSSLIVIAMLCLLFFASAVIQDESNYLYPT